MTSMLGVADFDLAKYANDERAQEDKLPLKNCNFSSAKDAYIEIFIKCRTDGGLPSAGPTGSLPSSSQKGKLNTSALLKMPVIEEKEGECDIKEEIEKKDKDYRKKLA